MSYSNPKNLKSAWKSGVKKKNVNELCTSATVSNGEAVFYLTKDNTSNGAPVFQDVYIESIQFQPLDTSNTYLFGSPSISANKKTMTVTINRLDTVVINNVLGFISAADGVVINLRVLGD